MPPRRTVHEKLFRAVVVMGAALGAAGCPEHGRSPPVDAHVVADAPKFPPVDAAVDTILIL
jgi:hypothetical protein